MSVRINSNQLSLNAQSRLGESTSKLTSSFSKLSSGLRITRASDDAAGLAISETLKTDARLSSQALRNVNDGISMISILNGALDAQKGILYRMTELAEQSANGVMSSEQRKPLQAEYMALQEEFDRVASAAKFNDISLLRNPDPSTIGLMAGITGTEVSLLQVAAANSHRFSGVLSLKNNDFNNDSFIDFVDLQTFSEYINDLDITEQNLQYFEDYSEIETTDSSGERVKIRFIATSILTVFNSSGIASDNRPGGLDFLVSAEREDGETASSFVSITEGDLASYNELSLRGL